MKKIQLSSELQVNILLLRYIVGIPVSTISGRKNHAANVLNFCYLIFTESCLICGCIMMCSDVTTYLDCWIVTMLFVHWLCWNWKHFCEFCSARRICLLCAKQREASISHILL